MNIAIFTDTYVPQINGVVTSVLSFRKELEKMGHRVYIFCPTFAGREKKEERVYRFFSIPYQTPAMKEQRISFPLSRALFLFPFLHIDIVHYQVTHFVGAYGLILAHIFKIPAVHTYHTLFVKYTHYIKLRKSLAVKAVKWISRQFCNRSVRVLTPSPEMKNELSTYGFKVPIEVLPTGIDFVRDRRVQDPDALRKKYNIPADRKLLVFVGRLAKEKNIELLFSVLQELNKNSPVFHLILVGDGPEREFLEKSLMNRKIQNEITLTGYISKERVLDIVQISDLMVFSSETETQGLVLLEAMSVGTPVVAVDAMGAGDVLRDGRGGIAVRPTVQSFLDAIELLTTDKKLYERKRLECLEKAEKWSASVMTRKLVDFYMRSIAEYRSLRRISRR